MNVSVSLSHKGQFHTSSIHNSGNKTFGMSVRAKNATVDIVLKNPPRSWSKDLGDTKGWKYLSFDLPNIDGKVL